MKEQLQNLLTKCIHDLIDQGLLSEMPSKVRLDHTKDKSWQSRLKPAHLN